MPPLLTHPYLSHLPHIDIQEALDRDPPSLRVDASAASCLASEGRLLVVRLMAANNALFGVYRYLVHQNPSIRLDGGTDEDSK